METIKDRIAQAESQYAGERSGSEWFRITGIPTRIRVLTQFDVYPQHFDPAGYKGVCIGADKQCPGCLAGKKPSIKWIGYVLHEDQVRVAVFPHTVLKQISDMQESEDFGFNSFPMPYDVDIKKEKSGDRPTDIKYSVTMRRTATELSPDQKLYLSEAKRGGEIVQKIKDKKIAELGNGEDTRVVPETTYAEYTEPAVELDMPDFSDIH